MTKIVFDLETTDLFPCGQILNYAFVCLHDDGRREELIGDIELSPGQLPSVDAINTTKINISDHLQGKLDDEFQAMSKIHSFLINIIENSQKQVVMVGHNIAKFDLHFLRTSLIRNGFNPYFGRNLAFADTIHLAKKYCVLRPDRIPSNFKLSTLVKEWLNCDDQSFHNSLSDVEHTINLLNFFEEDAKLTVNFNTYENVKFSKEELPATYIATFKGGKLIETPVVKISENRSYSLWLDLSVDYKSLGRSAVHWFKKDLSSFIPLRRYTNKNEIIAAMNFVHSEEQSYYNVETFFDKQVCDVENHIYLMPYSEIEIVRKAIHENKLQGLETASDYAKKLYMRSMMRRGNESILNKYVSNRYFNKQFVTDKSDVNITHWTLQEQYKKALELKSRESSNHINSLIELYENFAKKFDYALESC